MHVLVIGAGLSGVCTAWYLRQAGFEVTVVERQPGPALETSFANGGQISISHPEPWANPRAPMTALRWLGRADAPLRFRLRADLRQWAWALAFLRECSPTRTACNTSAIGHLARHSRDQLVLLREQLGLEYAEQTRGILHLFFDAEEADSAPERANVLRALGIPARVLDRDACLQIEPALAAVASRLHGALYGSDDESGDAHQFTTQLAERAYAAGVQFRFDCIVDALEYRADRVHGIHLREAGTAQLLEADATVVCAGSYGPQLLAPLGERLPIYPVKGYSVTVPIQDFERAPVLSLTDESRRIVCSRLGDRIRVAGTAELNGFDLNPDTARHQAILTWLQDTLPGVTRIEEAQMWCGLRPTTPSNRPWIGPSPRLRGLWYNTGHGTLGWTLACGSAQAFAELFCGRTPDVDFPFLHRTA